MSCCEYCGQPGDAQPYGPGATLICSRCAWSRPELIETVLGAMSTTLEAAEVVNRGTDA
jgi:hypothetical protein